jgi:hypothetical protein
MSYRNPTMIFSDIVCLNSKSSHVFAFSTPAIINEMLENKVLHNLSELKNNNKYVTGNGFKFILSNEDRSNQRDKHTTYSDHMLPVSSHYKITSVRIHYHYPYNITGFKFLDKEGALLWKIGETHIPCRVETVLIGENEVIFGVVAKLMRGYQSKYTDWQFVIIAGRWE